MSLRIISEKTARNIESRAATGSRGAEFEDTYITRLGKLVPGEAIAAYPVFFAGAQKIDAGSSGNFTVVLTSWVVLLVVLVLRWRATMSPEGRPQWPAIAISGIAFIIWVYVMEGDFGFANSVSDLVHNRLSLNLDGKFNASLALFAWTLIAPAIYTGDRG
jgi:hypothetical protein